MMPPPLLKVQALSKRFGSIMACTDVSFDLHAGQVIGIVGESGSGKSTLLNCVAGYTTVEAGSVVYYTQMGAVIEITDCPDPSLQHLRRSEWGFVHQNPQDGLLMEVSAGANIGERLMSAGSRHYGSIRSAAQKWLDQVEISSQRMDDPPTTFSGGMQQRLQLARVLVTHPRLVFMDEPTTGLDVSVQARFLDLVRQLVRHLQLSVILVTHDIGVVRLLAHRLMVMQNGSVVESGLTDQVLDDPQHPHTQLLVTSTLMP